MIQSIKKIYTFISLVLVLFLIPAVVQAAAVSFSEDTTINLTVGGTSTNFTIVGGSKADEITTETSALVFKISGGQTFTFRSSDRKKLENDGGIDLNCPSAYSELSITLPTGSGQRTIKITPSSDNCSTVVGGGGGGSSGGGGGGGGATAGTPAPTPTSIAPSGIPAGGRATPAAYGLQEGNTVAALDSSDPDVYIINEFGFKRLFLNQVIFSFYGHLGGFKKIKKISAPTRNAFVTSGLFRNCETKDPKVYGVEITGEDIGTLHHINMSGDQAVTEDPEFFKKVFCINSKEFNWYPKGTPYTSLSQVPVYNRGGTQNAPASPSQTINVRVQTGVNLNVRQQPTTKSVLLGSLKGGQIVTTYNQESGWYKIKFGGRDAWIFGTYVTPL